MIYDHVDLRVCSLAKARPLYDALLPAMGYSRITEDAENICYYVPGDERNAPFLALTADAGHHADGSRLALRAASREDVDRLAKIAQTHAARAFEPAALQPEYSPSYYATFFEDADGNKLEICFRSAP